MLVLICINQAVSYGQNVGIGITNPGTTLVVSKDVSSGAGILRLLNNSGSNLVSWIGFSHEEANGSADNSDRVRIGCVVQNSGNGHLFFSTGGMNTQAERMRITDNGYVGIGTTLPLTHLHVKGVGDQEISIESTDAGGRQWTIQSNGNSSPSTLRWSSPSSCLRWSSGQWPACPLKSGDAGPVCS